MCNLSLGIAKESAYRGYNLGMEKGRLEGREVGRLEGREVGRLEGRKAGRLEGEQNFGKLIQILIKEGNIEKIQEVTDDTALRELLYKKYHIQ